MANLKRKKSAAGKRPVRKNATQKASPFEKQEDAEDLSRKLTTDAFQVYQAIDVRCDEDAYLKRSLVRANMAAQHFSRDYSKHLLARLTNDVMAAHKNLSGVIDKAVSLIEKGDLVHDDAHRFFRNLVVAAQGNRNALIEEMRGDAESDQGRTIACKRLKTAEQGVIETSQAQEKEALEALNKDFEKKLLQERKASLFTGAGVGAALTLFGVFVASMLLG